MPCRPDKIGNGAGRRHARPRHAPSRTEAVTRPEDYRDAPGWLREAYPALFAHPDLRDRLAWQELVFRGPEALAEPQRWTEILEGALASADRLMALLA